MTVWVAQLINPAGVVVKAVIVDAVQDGESWTFSPPDFGMDIPPGWGIAHGPIDLLVDLADRPPPGEH